ncbi:hypothetical protein QYE76_002645 [Lolium multiflorum]|uniref:CCHC-type domain-containing protein n=1 Tax=Lolium multiflorum TaxID=4521 RepID=A0AAD8RNY0_LOLMU|nr:hypothetical protein QYE76_002645 [Lolium multiflorum]
MAEGRTPRSRRWSDIADEEDEEMAISEAFSKRSYSDVVKDGSPSPVRAASPEVLQRGGASSSRPQAVRRLASVVSRPVPPRVAGGGAQQGHGGAQLGHGGRRGPLPKRQRHRAPLPSFVVPPGVPAGFDGLCFNCAEPGHVAGMCTGPRRCLNCKSENHVARNCTLPVAPVAGDVAVGAPPPPRGGPPPQARLPAPVVDCLPDAGAQGERYRIPARQRLGARGGSPPPPPPPALQGRLGDRGAPATETPYERGLRVERAIRAEPPLRPEERAQGLGFRDREAVREQMLRGAALRSVAEIVAEVEEARPARERGIIYRTQEVEGAERALRWGLVAFVSGTRRLVSGAAASAAILERFPELDGHFSVHTFWPAELLLVFDSRAKRDTLLTSAANPFDGRDFSLRFGVWNRQLQATRRCFRYRVHLEVVGVPPIAWSMDTAKTILGSSGWVERLGSETASRADLGTFCITAWTGDLASLPRSKKLWLAEPLRFGGDGDDLLLPVEALVPEEVALLAYEADVHIVRVEDTVAADTRSSNSSAPGPGPDDGDAGEFDSSRRQGPPPDDRRQPPASRGEPAAARGHRWRGGAERRVALGRTTSVLPWPSVPVDDGAPRLAVAAPVCTYEGWQREPRVLEQRPVEPAAALARGGDDISVGGFEGFDLESNRAPSSRSVHDSSSSSASIQPSSPRGWPEAQPVLWATDGDPLSPRGPLSPTGSLSATPPAVVRAVEVEEGEIVEDGIDCRLPPAQAPTLATQTPPPVVTPAATPTPVVTPAATPTGSGSVDLRCGLAAFREKCRLKRASLLPRPPPRKPRKKRSPPSVVRRSARVAGRFSSGGSIKMQQRILIHQLGIAREGEVIGEDALQAYLRFFNEKPMTADHLAACLALFGWLPEALPVAEDELVV